MKRCISIFLILSSALSQSIESKEAAYVTVADESGYTQIAVVDLTNPQIVTYLPIDSNALGGNIVQTHDGKSLFLAGYRSDKIYQIDIKKNTVVDSMAVFHPYRIALTSDEQYILSTDTGAPNSKISFIKWAEKKIVYEITEERYFGSEILITPDGRLAYVVGPDRINVIDISAMQSIKNIILPGVRSLIWHKRNGLLYAIDGENRSIAKIDSSSHQVIDRIQLDLEGTLNLIRFNCCEDKLYASTNIEHHLVDLITEKTIRRMPSMPFPPNSLRMPKGEDLSFTPNSKQVYLIKSYTQAIDFGATSTPGQVWIISTLQNVILYKLDIGFQPDVIAMIVYPQPIPGDFNSDQQIEFEDFILFASMFGTKIGDEDWRCNYDLVWDGKINFADFIQFVQLFGGG